MGFKAKQDNMRYKGGQVVEPNRAVVGVQPFYLEILQISLFVCLLINLFVCLL
jgi:hypothetical protein